MAKIRLVRGVLNDTGHINPTLWRAQLAMGLPVGFCDCGGNAHGEPLTRDGTLLWADMACTRCHATASRKETCRPVVAGVAPLVA